MAGKAAARDDSDDQPTFNLKAVVRETNLKPDTLRAWERRYGLPQPDRTPGGHRLYSQRDIEILKWLTARQDEGLSISRAVELWRRLEADGQDPLADAAPAVAEPDRLLVALETGDPLHTLRREWVAACLEFNEQRAEHAMTQAFALYPPETVCIEILQHGLAQIGRGWYEGDVSVQQEHFASALAVRRLETLIAATPPPTRIGRLLVGCPPHEEHIFSPLFLTLMLRRRGLNVVYLGANVPQDRLEATLEQARPQLVVLTAQTLPTAATLLPIARQLHQDRIPLAYGGLIFNNVEGLTRKLPGSFLGPSLPEAPRQIEQLLADPAPALAAAPDDPQTGYQQALDHFTTRLASVEARVWEQMRDRAIANAQLSQATRDLGRYVTAALALGDIHFLGYDLRWVAGMLRNLHHQLDGDHLPAFLAGYRQALVQQLDGRGKLIIDWLARVLEEMKSVGRA